MKFLGWAPDLHDFIDVSDSIYLHSIYNLYPSSNGYRVFEASAAITSNALAAQCIGAASVTKTSGARRTFASALDTIYEYSAGSWSDVTTPTLTGTSTSRCIFAQFGDATIATNDADQLMVSTSGNFAAISGSPKAKTVFTVPNFVIVLNTQDGSGSTSYGDSPDRWWCSGFQDHTVWTPALSTQCASGRLIGGGGPLTAGAKFGNGFVAYKEREMWLATYVGAPEVFRFDGIPGDVGCVGPEAVVDIGGAHIFVGSDNIWLYDGTRPRSIADGLIREWFFDQVPPDQLQYTRILFDRSRMLVWIYYNTAQSYAGTTNGAICYHLNTGMWGRGENIVCQSNFVYYEPGLTWATVASTYPTWASMADITWDNSAFYGGGRTLSYIGDDKILYGYSAAPIFGFAQTKAFGTPGQDTTMSQINARGYFGAATANDAIPFLFESISYDGAGNILTSTPSWKLSGNATFRGRSTGRFHRVTGNIVSDQVLWGADVKIDPAGTR